jgi:type II secretory pathway component PulM
MTLTPQERAGVAWGAALLALVLLWLLGIMPLQGAVDKLQRRLPVEQETYRRAVELRARIARHQPQPAGAHAVQPLTERVRQWAGQFRLADRIGGLQALAQDPRGVELKLSEVAWEPLVSMLGELERAASPVRVIGLELHGEGSGLFDAALRLVPDQAP